MNVLLICLLAQPAQPAQPASQPASRPSSLVPGGTAADLSGNVTWIYQVDEQVLRVQESWTINNDSGKLVGKEHVRFHMPPNTRRLTVDEDARGFKGNEESTEIFATEAIGSGQKQFGNAHMIDFAGGEVTVTRTLPIRTIGARLIIENIQSLKVEANVETTERISELNGLEFKVINLAPVPAGGTLSVTFDGLPSKVTWPRRLAVLVSLLVVGWMAVALRSNDPHTEARLGPLSAEARRDQIVKAIEILDRDLTEERIKQKRYDRRHAELMGELAAVLREIETQKQKSA